MKRGLVILVLLAAGCGDNLSPEERAMRDESDIAMVERANQAMPPLREVTPEPILYPDIERHDLFGAACNYAPGTSLGTRVIAREADAFMKVGGEIIRFAADPGSRALPLRTRSLYNSREYALRLRIRESGEQPDEGPVDYEGEVTLFDAHGRIAYEGEGLARCGS